MSHRRSFVIVLLAGALAPRLAGAQQRPPPRVGLLLPELPSIDGTRLEALREGLRELGYVEGKTITLEIRSADGDYERLPQLAAELVRLKVDVIVAFGSKAVSAASAATTTIPIVDPVMGDPVAMGLSDSLARPGRNVTGSVQFSVEGAAKRIELLKEAVPRIQRVAALVNPVNKSTKVQLEAMRATANARKVELQAFEAHDERSLREALAKLERGRTDAIVVASDTLMRGHAAAIAEHARKQGLPSAGTPEVAAAGCLIGYGPDSVRLYSRSAYFVDRLLKGAKPDDLPIERATEIELVINLKTAKAIGVTIPQPLLLRATGVIQ